MEKQNILILENQLKDRAAYLLLKDALKKN